MGNIIYKYAINITDEQVIELPKGAEILTAQLQDKILQMWAIVNPNAEKQKRVIEIYGTGHPFPFGMAERKYIATVQKDGLVWHIFEFINP